MGKTQEEIAATRQKAETVMKENGYEVVDRPVIEKRVYPTLYGIAKNLEAASQCKVAYFCKGWEKDLEGKIVHEATDACWLFNMHEE
jgi:hypothetical protein